MKRSRRKELESKIRCALFLIGLQMMWILPCAYAYNRDYIEPNKIDNTAGVHLHIQEDEVSVAEEVLPATTQPAMVSLGTFKLTAYCPCSKCCGKWSDGITSTGTVAEQGRIIAVDPSIIPYGTVVIINGQAYIAEDCGGSIKGNRIDVFFDSHQDALEFGIQHTEVFICQ